MIREGDLVSTALHQADGVRKVRPSLVLRRFRPNGDVLLCGLSRQAQQEVDDFDEWIVPGDADFPLTKLNGPSIIRLGFLMMMPQSEIVGRIGRTSSERHTRLLRRLAGYLSENLP